MARNLKNRIEKLIYRYVDVIDAGDLSDRDPLKFSLRGESFTARIYSRYNGTLVLCIEGFVDAYKDVPELSTWVAKRSAKYPFASLFLKDQNGTGSVSLFVSHSMIATLVTDKELYEVLEAMVWRIRRARSSANEIIASVNEGKENHPSDDPMDVLERFSELQDDELIEIDIESLATELEFGEVIVRAPKQRKIDDILNELDQLIGLQEVKEAVRRFVDLSIVNGERRRKGLQVVETSPHLVFVGNPGTGKTTVARLVGEIYRSLGLINSGHLIEASRADLVAAYLGQTAIKTEAICKRALGGVLFIDEAYSLTNGRDDYGIEAIDALTAFMENHRGEFAVVVAGYPQEMKRFMDSNQGLKSRFDLTIEFPDYSDQELEEIFNIYINSNDYFLTVDAREKLRKVIQSWPKQRGFGNARDVRKLFHDVVTNQAGLLRNRKASTETMRELPVEAIPNPVDRSRSTKRPKNVGYL